MIVELGDIKEVGGYSHILLIRECLYLVFAFNY